jgi:hypothetical protein
MIAIKKLLAPTDFSEYSRFALKYAVALAESFQARSMLSTFMNPILTARCSKASTTIRRSWRRFKARNRKL